MRYRGRAAPATFATPTGAIRGGQSLVVEAACPASRGHSAIAYLQRSPIDSPSSLRESDLPTQGESRTLRGWLQSLSQACAEQGAIPYFSDDEWCDHHLTGRGPARLIPEVRSPRHGVWQGRAAQHDRQAGGPGAQHGSRWSATRRTRIKRSEPKIELSHRDAEMRGLNCVSQFYSNEIKKTEDSLYSSCCARAYDPELLSHLIDDVKRYCCEGHLPEALGGRTLLPPEANPWAGQPSWRRGHVAAHGYWWRQGVISSSGPGASRAGGVHSSC